MGYAKLIYNPAIQATSLISDMAKVITGTITDKSQLEFCNTASSEIVNSLGENWSYAFDGTGTQPKVLVSPCIDTNKNKFVVLRTFDASGTSVDVSGTLSTTSIGILMHGARSITTSPSLTIDSTSYYNISTNSSFKQQNIFGRNASTEIYISWSNRHLLVYGDTASSSGIRFNLSAEFPENELSLFSGGAPAAHLSYTTAASNTDASLVTSPTPSGTADIFNSLVTYDQYVPPSSSVNSIYAHHNATGSGTFPRAITANSDIAPSVNTLGQTAYYFVPLWYASVKVGMPIMNFSSLTNVYVTAKQAGVTEDVITINGNPYVVLAIANSAKNPTATYASLMVLKQ
jgi:hypothetical protein